MNPALETVPRNDRRRLLAAAAKNRKSGQWGDWEMLEFPSGPSFAGGWVKDVRSAYRNTVFCVLVRPLGRFTHLAISSLSGERPTWREMQRIKNEILGDDATAVEVYPPDYQVVDGADMFHLWSVDPLPFSIWSGDCP
jgi:hypothetical protein